MLAKLPEKLTFLTPYPGVNITPYSGNFAYAPN